MIKSILMLLNRRFFLSCCLLSITNVAFGEHASFPRPKPAVQQHAEYFDEWQSPSFDCDPIWKHNLTWHDMYWFSHANDIPIEAKYTICNSALLSYIDRMQGLGLKRVDDYLRPVRNGRSVVFAGGNDKRDLFLIDTVKAHKALLGNHLYICDPTDSACLLRVYLNSTVYCNYRFSITGYSDLVQFCGRAWYWRYLQSAEQNDKTFIEQSFLDLLKPYTFPDNAPLPLKFIVSQTELNLEKSWYDDKYGNRNDPWIGFNDLSPLPEYWPDDAGVLGVLNHHPRREELICGLPIVLESVHPESTSLPDIQRVAKVSRREDEIFTTLNLHKSLTQEDLVNPDVPSGQFKVVDRFFAEEMGDPTPFWATSTSHYAPHCFPVPDKMDSKHSYFLEYSEPMYAYRIRGPNSPSPYIPDRTYIQATHPYTTRIEYQRVLGDRDPRYYTRQILRLNISKTYAPNPYQVYFSGSYIGDGNAFYSTGEDSPEGWFIYFGDRLGSTWSSEYLEKYKWELGSKHPEDFQANFTDLSFSRLWMGSRDHLTSFGDRYYDRDSIDQGRFLVAGGVSGYRINALPPRKP